MIYIGIDPGLGGGIAALVDGGHVLETHKMPETPADLVECFDQILSRRSVEGAPVAMLERVSASPQMGVTSAFTFGKGYGGLLVALAAARIPYDQIVPAKWQTALGCRSHGEKNITKRRAQDLFPHQKITHAIADALLLAEYCRRFHRGHQAATDQPGAATNGEEEARKGRQAGDEQKPAQRTAKRFRSTQGSHGI